MSAAHVLVLQSMCKQYRAPLFARMYEELAADGICLRVAYSAPLSTHRNRKDDVDLPSNYGTRIRQHTFLGERLVWQAPAALIQKADLVIVEHAVKHLINYPLLALSLLGFKRLGFWVHGGTLRHPSSPLLRPYRRWSMLAANWIFAYTEGVSKAAIALGAQPERVTTLQNAIDLSGFRAALNALPCDQLHATRTQLNIGPGSSIALFCGSLYPGRGIDFLIKVGERIVYSRPNFHLLVIGGGPLESELESAARTRPWLHPLGTLFGDQRALYFRLAQVCFMPYLAGLGILDAMVAGLPFLVTGAHATNPEIDYLIDGVTGLVTGDSVDHFADAAVSLFSDPPRLQAMSDASRAASQQYSIENMASNFCRGIRGCLGQTRSIPWPGTSQQERT